MRAKKSDQSCSDSVAVGKGADQNQIVIVSFKQLEALCAARDEEGFLFIAADDGFDQDGETSIVVVDGLDVPS